METIFELARKVRTKEEAVKYLQERGILHKERFCKNGHSMRLCPVRKNTESDREYRNGHRIGSRIPNRPSISVFKCENIESDGPNSHVNDVISLT